MATNDFNMPDATTDLWLEQQRADDMLQPEPDAAEFDGPSHKKSQATKPHKPICLPKTAIKKSKVKTEKPAAKEEDRIKRKREHSDL